MQSIHYKKSIWTADSARSHCDSRDGSFTAAGESDKIEIEINGDFIGDERNVEEIASKISDAVNKKEIRMAVSLNSKGRSKANSLIGSGNVDKTSSWSFSAEDGNKILGDPPDWNVYGSWHLGQDTSQEAETKAHWKYPFGKNGKVYRSGLIAIRQRAAAQNETDIYDAAGALINKIDGNQDMSWFEIKLQTEEMTELFIYDEIGYWGVTAKDFVKEINAVKSARIDMHINSPGGDVFDGSAVYNAIKRHPAKVTTYIDGLAASIASIIALAGEKVVMADNAIYMMHNPWGLVVGNSEDMRKQADVLDKIRDTMTGTYSNKSGKSIEEIHNLLNAETWMDAKEALEAGFVDEISGAMDMAACAKFGPVMAKMGYKHIPETFNPHEKPTARDAEKALRDAGFSSKASKTILSKGLPDDLRDVDQPEEEQPESDVVRDAEVQVKEDKHKTKTLLEDENFMSY